MTASAPLLSHLALGLAERLTMPLVARLCAMPIPCFRVFVGSMPDVEQSCLHVPPMGWSLLLALVGDRAPVYASNKERNVRIRNKIRKKRGEEEWLLVSARGGWRKGEKRDKEESEREEGANRSGDRD